MTVNKLSYPAKENATQQKINEIIDDYVDLPSNQNITGVKTFVGQKRISFKQSGSSDKLGFTLYNNNNVEKGYLEFNPTNTIDGAPLMTLGNYASSIAAITHVGFRKYSSVSGASGAYNLLAPLISNAKTPFNLTTTYTNFYLPLGFTDGATMVTTANTGVVNISSLLPDISGKQNTLTAGSNITISGDTISATDTTYSDFTGADSITAGTSGLVPAPSVGDNDKILTGGATWNELKTVNSTSLLGNGNIDTSEIFVATYGTTTYQEITDALVAGKYPICEVMGAWGVYSSSAGHKHNFTNYYNGVLQNLYVNSSNVWNYENLMPADTTLSNVSSIDSDSAVKTALDDKVNKSGDTMTGGLTVNRANTNEKSIIIQNPNIIAGTNPNEVKYSGIVFNDNNDIQIADVSYSCGPNGDVRAYIQTIKYVSNQPVYAGLAVGFDTNGNAFSTFSNTKCCDGQWVSNSNILSSSTTIGTTSMTSTLNSIIPNDGYAYEILIDIVASTGSGRTSTVAIVTSLSNPSTNWNLWLSPSSATGCVRLLVPVAADRVINKVIQIGDFDNCFVYLSAYRRLGTNS